MHFNENETLGSDATTTIKLIYDYFWNLTAYIYLFLFVHVNTGNCEKLQT